MLPRNWIRLPGIGIELEGAYCMLNLDASLKVCVSDTVVRSSTKGSFHGWFGGEHRPEKLGRSKKR